MPPSRMLEGLARLLLLVSGGLLAWPAGAPAQMATADRVQEPGWWPTKAASPEDFVGPRRCVECHPRQAGQTTTAMARTAFRAVHTEVLRTHDHLTFAHGPYRYAIEKEGPGSLYTVSDGVRSVSAALLWAFGVGKVGQTYLFEKEGTFHEARVSYFDLIEGLDFTPVRKPLGPPRDVEEAMGRPLDDAEARRCFACHTTASTTEAGLDLSALVPGITCEACHGPGREHSDRMERSGWAPAMTILNPEAFDPVDSVDFCGACHSTFWDVRLSDEKGVAALRSQPYRLQSSRCWDERDARITCTACHDVHRSLQRDPRAYDERCLACHAITGAEPSSARPGRACRVASADCASCHMPKYEVEEMHAEFTDHLIRVVTSKDDGRPALERPTGSPGPNSRSRSRAEGP